MKNGVLALNRQGQIIYSNPQMNSFFEKKNLEGQTIYSLMRQNENLDNDPFWDIILEVIHGHAIHYQKRVSYSSPTGRKYKFHIISSYLAGNLCGAVGDGAGHVCSQDDPDAERKHAVSGGQALL